jgi:hypothetical protein
MFVSPCQKIDIERGPRPKVRLKRSALGGKKQADARPQLLRKPIGFSGMSCDPLKHGHHT